MNSQDHRFTKLALAIKAQSRDQDHYDNESQDGETEDGEMYLDEEEPQTEDEDTDSRSEGEDEDQYLTYESKVSKMMTLLQATTVPPAELQIRQKLRKFEAPKKRAKVSITMS